MIKNRYYFGLDIRVKLNARGKILAAAALIVMLAPLLRHAVLLGMGANGIILFMVSSCLFAIFAYYLVLDIMLYPYFVKKTNELLLNDEIQIMECYSDMYERFYTANATIYEFVEVEIFPQVKHTDLNEIKEGLVRLKEVAKNINQYRSNG